MVEAGLFVLLYSSKRTVYSLYRLCCVVYMFCNHFHNFSLLAFIGFILMRRFISGFISSICSTTSQSSSLNRDVILTSYTRIGCVSAWWACTIPPTPQLSCMPSCYSDHFGAVTSFFHPTQLQQLHTLTTGIFLPTSLFLSP